jgi:hypothetical protein
MSYDDDQRRREQLERSIRQNQRSLNDPYVQDKWVERESIERARRELERMNDNNNRNRGW